MAEPLSFDFAEPPVDPRSVSPTGQPLPPINGTRPETRHASWTGARAVVHTWAAKQSAYLQLLAAGGALTDNDAAALLQWPLSSVCSTRNAVVAQLETDGLELKTWDEGRTTRRTRWRLKRNRREVSAMSDEPKEDDNPDAPETGAADGSDGEQEPADGGEPKDTTE